MHRSRWTRRHFVGSSAAALAFGPRSFTIPAQQAQSAAQSPEEIAGTVRQLLLGHTARPLRYQPHNGGFLIHNGREFFNRPLYGPNVAFRVDCGDLPEFSLYLPGHGGNLRLGVLTEGATARWLSEADDVRALYRDGAMAYEIRDTLLGAGMLQVEAVTSAGRGLFVQVTAAAVPEGLQLVWAFGGVSGRKGKRGGDIGCEAQPVSQFFQVSAEECAGNVYTISGTSVQVKAKAIDLTLDFPPGSKLRLSDGKEWNRGWQNLSSAAGEAPQLPVLIGSAGIVNTTPLQISLEQGTVPAEMSFADRKAQLGTLAARLTLATPDPFVDCLAGALAVAGDALWDEKQRCVMHGAVAWRMALAGWRGPYMLDSLGWHDRFREHARHWIAKQNRNEVTTATPARGGPDPGSHLARSEKMLHTQGDLSNNHYDMNLVFFDALLRHLSWTGDLAFAREIWPALVLHLAWERRLFRRIYRTEQGEELPLYEAYACIWASDNLQYNGGGAAHSSAYNYFANYQAARLATLLGKDPEPYAAEADAILRGMRALLWLPTQGTFGESKDLLGPQTVYTSPALWSMYHSIDSRVTSPKEAWQMAVERLGTLRSVPVEGAGVPPGGTMLSCSDWLPYEWSLNLLLLAENMHMALSLWQAGMVEEAFALFQGNLLDSMFQGLTPGNFHMTSQLDDHRQEAQRDFGDPIGCTARALVEGLFGVRPDLLAGRLELWPGFPAAWPHASLHHADFEYTWQRTGDHEELHFTSRFARPVRLAVTLAAPRTGPPQVVVNGIAVAASFKPDAVGTPLLTFECPVAPTWKIEVHWQGESSTPRPLHRKVSLGEQVAQAGHEVDDPQDCLRNGRAVLPGIHTIFVRHGKGACRWWMPISFEVAPAAVAIPALAPGLRSEPLDLSHALNSRITEIFSREYLEPRSPFCSLSIPQSGTGGWATFDRRPTIDDRGLRALNGELRLPSGIVFRTPAGDTSNCLFLSHWQQDPHTFRQPLSGSAHGLALLLAGTTLPQCSRMTHAEVQVYYTDDTSSSVQLRNPDNWWPIEQDYLIDDYLFVNSVPPPVRVDLMTGVSRLPSSGGGRSVAGGSAQVIVIPIDPRKQLVAFEIQVKLYGIIAGLMAGTLLRS